MSLLGREELNLGLEIRLMDDVMKKEMGGNFDGTYTSKSYNVLGVS